MSRSQRFPALLGALLSALLAGCSTKNAPDDIMLTSPTGLWVGKADSGTTVDIESGGTFKLTRAGRELAGTWADGGSGTLKVSMTGQTYDVPYRRKDLGLQIALPGETQLTDFEQM